MSSRRERPLSTAPEEIRSARLLLRKPRLTDGVLMFNAYAQDPAVTRFLMWRPHRDIAESGDVIERFLAKWKKGGEFCWFLFTNDTGEMIGSIAVRVKDTEFNLGFVLARGYWGRGYMPEAISAVVDWAFTHPWISRVSAVCDIENYASARALEKAGFCREGILHRFLIHPNISSAPRDCYAYALTRRLS